ncbi:MAG: HAD-IIIA family hydrolase [Bacteroidetes bacterium]|nr:HAD-IIIA family hydrolase [Bacteroidota bacterium]
MNILENFKPDKSWTLFLDRDGVINVNRDNDYVKSWEEFEFIGGSLEAIKYFSEVFGRIVVVTNQQGIGKGLMTDEDLSVIHTNMLESISNAGGRIDKIYYCPELAETKPKCRKPETGMGLQAKKDFPEIEFNTSIMVGDSEKDMNFAERLGMKKFFVNGSVDKFDDKLTRVEITNLSRLASFLQELVG